MRTFAATVTIALTACAACPSAEAFVFNFASGGAATGDHKAAMDELLSAFRAEHPEVSIEYDVSTSYIRGVTETLMQEFGNTPPDVAVVGLVEWPILQRRGLLRKLDAALSRQDIDQIWRQLLPENKVQQYGKEIPVAEYALPFNRGYPLLYANTKLLPGLGGKISVTLDALEHQLVVAQRKNPEAKKKLVLSMSGDDWAVEALMLSARKISTLKGSSSHFGDAPTLGLVRRLRSLSERGLVRLEPAQRDSYDRFVAGEVAAILVSSSAYQSIARRVRFPFRALMPPRIRFNAVNTGGGDLVLPVDPGKPLDEKKKSDIRKFILWMYTGNGSALWAKVSSMFPLTKPAAESKTFKDLFARKLLGKPLRGPRLLDYKVFRNAENWTVRSFYELDEFCNILKLRQTAQRAFRDAVTGPDPAVVLKQADGFAAKLIAEKKCQ